MLRKYDIAEGVMGLIFDLDGTIVDSMPYHYKAWQMACDEIGATLTPELLATHTGKPTFEVAEELLIYNQLQDKISVEQFADSKARYFISMIELLRPIEPVVDIVKRYYGVLPMAVGSGGSRKIVEQSLVVTGLDKYFEVVVTASDVTLFKPHPETFLKCAELINVDPQYIEVFEDGEPGLQAAKTAGMIATDVRSWYDSDYV